MPLLQNEKTLVQHLILGEADAFREIYEGYHKQVYVFALYLTKSKDDAEEIVQQVFINLWEKRALLTEDTKLLAYIKAMTQNQVISSFRKAAHDKAYRQKLLGNMAALQQVPASELMNARIEKIYGEALAQLSPQQRLVFLLAQHEGLSYEEIAQKLGLSRHTVHTHMKEAARSIRNYVQGHPDVGCLVLAILLSATDH